MTPTLAKILALPEEEISKMIKKFEDICGNPSEDVRLLADNEQTLRVKISDLGLDPDDTTDEEMYYALRNRYQRDSRALDRALGVDIYTDLDKRLVIASQLVELCASADDVWVIKKSAAKTVLVKNPPKTVAKLLHYRSVNSLVKREDVAGIYLAASVVESATWRRNINKQLSKLNDTDYEMRPIKVINLPDKYSQHTGDSHASVVVDRLMGVTALWPAQGLNKAPILNLVLLLLQGLKELNPNGYSDSLHSMNPALRWWADNDFLISPGGYNVSFNIKDVAINHLNDHQVDKAAANHAAKSMWQVLTSRYQRISDSVSEFIVNENSSTRLPADLKPPPGRELAAELAMVE